MNWLNLNEKILNSPEFSAAEVQERGVWISLLRFCMSQENEGVIIGAGNWKERKWMSTLGVSLSDVQMDSELWSWRGSNLAVWGYPSDKEKEVKMRREQARINGQKGGRKHHENGTGEPKYLDEIDPEKTNVGTDVGSNVAPDIGKRKRREEKGKEGNSPLEGTTPLARAHVRPCTHVRGGGEGPYQAAAF